MQKLKIKTQNQHSVKLTTPKASHLTTSSFIRHPSSIVPRGRKDEARETKLIPLTQGQFAIVDADDYERLAVHKWCLGGKKGQYYAQRKDHARIVLMHHEIIDVPAGMFCDHINHNRLDNRKCNLRSCTYSQNAQNSLPGEHGTSRYKGVCRYKATRKWMAYIGYQNRVIHIGYFDDEEEAAIAYDDMAIKLFGEFACLNCHYRPKIRQWLQDCYLFLPHEIGQWPPSHGAEPEFLKEVTELPKKSHISLF